MSVSTYDIKDVNLVVNGVIITGFAEGSVITSEKNEDNFSTHVGVKGEVTFAESNDPTGMITCVLKNTSPSVSYLEGLSNKKGKNAIISAQVIDLNTNGVNSGGTECRVMKPANKEYSNEETEREFSIYVADYTTK